MPVRALFTISVILVISMVGTMEAQDRISAEITFGGQRVGTSGYRKKNVDTRMPMGRPFRESLKYPLEAPFRARPENPGMEYQVDDEGHITILAEFHPINDSTYLDTLILTRDPMPGQVSTVLVIFSGVGFRNNDRTFVVNFNDNGDSIFIGDSVFKQRPVPVQPAESRRYRPIDTLVLDPPFSLVVTNINNVPDGQDIIIGAAFQPTVGGQYRDTLAFVRFDTLRNNEVIIDTLTFICVGEAKEQRDRMEFTFTGMVNDPPKTSSQKLVVDARDRYTYSMSTLSDGPSTVVMKRLSSDPDTIVVQMTFNPTKVGTFIQEGMLYRMKGSKAVDSTKINCTSTVRPRPLKLTLSLSPSQATVNIGDTVTIAVVATADTVPDAPADVTSASFTFSYDPTVLIPLQGSHLETNRSGDIPTFSISVTKEDSLALHTAEDTVARVRCLAVLGDAERVVVHPIASSFTCEQASPPPSTTLNDAVITIGDIWEHQGGPRLVNSLRGTCDITVDPNPVRSSSVMTLINVPTGVGSLQIITTAGALVRDLTADVRNGVRTFTITSGGGSIALTPGTYYARLLVGASADKSVYSVVRMIVVE